MRTPRPSRWRISFSTGASFPLRQHLGTRPKLREPARTAHHERQALAPCGRPRIRLLDPGLLQIRPLSMSKPLCGVWPPTLSLCASSQSRNTGIDRAALVVQHRLHFPDVAACAWPRPVSARARRPAASRTPGPSNGSRSTARRPCRRRPASASPPGGRPSSWSMKGPFSQTLSQKPSAGSFFTSILMPAFAALA